MDTASANNALLGVRDGIRAIPLENISTLARDWLGDEALIPLWFGEGDLPAPAFIGAAMARAVADGHVFYTHQNGVRALRQALADYQSGLGATRIDAERITVTTSGMHAILMAVMMVAAPGDNIIAVDPVWPNIGGAARVAGVALRSVRMDEGPDGWSLDLDRLAAAMDARTRMVFFASPGNPTGAMLPMATQRAILGLCRARGAWLVADEVYNRVVFGARSAPTILDHAEDEDRLLVVNSFSKSWAMTGWRIGWITHPPSLGPTLAMITQYSNSGVATFIQHAAVAAVQDGEPFVAKFRDYCEAGMAIVCDALDALPRVRMGARPKAGMYAFFRVDGLPDARAACLDILQKTRVGLAPGAFFGPGSESYFRICICRSPSSLHEAMERLGPVFS
ncbi:MAG TPA: pyridoxal phosphate-dependent aminotransferase [Caulobacteraceae bacterium]